MLGSPDMKSVATQLVNALITGGHIEIDEGQTDAVMDAVAECLSDHHELEAGVLTEVERRGSSTTAGAIETRMRAVATEFGVEIGATAYARIVAELILDDDRVEEVFAADDALVRIIEEACGRFLPGLALPGQPATGACPRCDSPDAATETLFIDGDRVVVCPECRDDALGLARTCKNCGNYFEELIAGECNDCRGGHGGTVAAPGEFVCYISQQIYPEEERCEVDYLGAPLSIEAARALAAEGDYNLLKWAYEMGFRYCPACRSFKRETVFDNAARTDFLDVLTCRECAGPAPRKAARTAAAAPRRGTRRPQAR